MNYHSILLLSLSLFIISCNGTKKGSADNPAPETIEKSVQVPSGPLSLGIKRSQCFGKCPVFEFTVNRAGEMTYTGKMHVEKLGVWKGQMPTESRDALWQYFSEQQTKDLKALYNSGAMDTPKSSLMIERKDSMQRIAGDFSMPKRVTAIIDYIDSLSNSFDMTLYEAKVPRTGILPGEAIIDLAPNGDVDMVCKEFEEYGLFKKRRISPALSLYLLIFDEDKIKPGRMLALLKAHPMVQEAQFNKSADQRDD